MWWSNKGKDKGTGEIVRVSKAGGPTVSVRTGLDSPYGIALGDGAMAWGLARLHRIGPRTGQLRADFHRIVQQ